MALVECLIRIWKRMTGQWYFASERTVSREGTDRNENDDVANDSGSWKQGQRYLEHEPISHERKADTNLVTILIQMEDMSKKLSISQCATQYELAILRASCL